jgi:small conductance mechanosensitive channel
MELLKQLANFKFILSATTTFFVAFVVYFFVMAGLKRALNKHSENKLLAQAVVRFARVFGFLAMIIITLSSLGLRFNALTALVGSAGIAIGLALKGKITNVADGISILILKPFKEGDYIESGAIKGTVKDLGLFTTQLVTPDNQRVIVQNEQLFSNPITNYTALPTRRINETIGISYDDDPETAKKILLEMMASHDLFLKDPEPQIFVSALADSSVNLSVRVWVNRPDFLQGKSDLFTLSKKALEAGDLSIPFPQMDVHFDKES